MDIYKDDELLSMLKDGSLAAYEMLFKRYYALLCLQATVLLKDTTKAEDLTEEFFIDFWEKKIYRRIDHSLKSYLCTAIRNRCLTKIDKDKKLRAKTEEYTRYKSELLKKQDSSVSDNDRLHRLNQLLTKFPSQRLRAFTLVYLEKKKYREAAEEMGVSVNSVKTHLKMGLEYLRQQMTR